MADLEIKKGETFPGIKGLAFDADGPIDMTGADKIEVRIKGTGATIVGAAEVIDPPEVDGQGQEWNYKRLWDEGETDVAGDDYQHELWIYWDEGSTPPRIQKLPNKLTENPTITISEDLE